MPQVVDIKHVVAEKFGMIAGSLRLVYGGINIILIKRTSFRDITRDILMLYLSTFYFICSCIIDKQLKDDKAKVSDVIVGKFNLVAVGKVKSYISFHFVLS